MKIGERGQVTIPMDIRNKYGLLPNIEVDFVPEQEGVLIKKKASKMSPVEQIYGILKKNNEIIYAELAPQFESQTKLDDTLKILDIRLNESWSNNKTEKKATPDFSGDPTFLGPYPD